MLRKPIFLILAVSLSALLPGPMVRFCSASGDGINWRSSLPEALKEAGEKGKFVYLDIYSDDCPACVMLDRKVYSEGSVAELLNRFVPVRINGQKNPSIMRQYRADAFPTLLLLDSKGNVLDVSRGAPRTKEAFIEVFGDASLGVHPLEKLEKKALEPEADSQTRLTIAQELILRDRTESALKILNLVEEETRGDSKYEGQLLQARYFAHLYGGRFEQAENVLKAYLEKYPDSNFESTLLAMVGRDLIGQGRFEQALAVLDHLSGRLEAGSKEEEQRVRYRFFAHLFQDQYPEARKVAEEYMEGFPAARFEDTLVRVGIDLLKDPEEASKARAALEIAADRIREGSTNHELLLRHRVQAEAAAGSLSRAGDLAKEYAETYADSGHHDAVRMSLAEKYKDHEQYTEAIGILEQVKSEADDFETKSKATHMINQCKDQLARANGGK